MARINVATSRPWAESANVEFNVLGQRLAERVKIALDDGVVDPVKNGPSIVGGVDHGGANCLEKSAGVFGVHGIGVIQKANIEWTGPDRHFPPGPPVLRLPAAREPDDEV